MAGPSKVEFPGGNKQKIRMRGTKRASDSVQKKLRKSLDSLRDNPRSTLPEILGPTSQGFGRRDKMKACMKDIDRVLARQNDSAWLKKRMAKKGGDLIAKALAGSLVAAMEEEIDTVAVFRHPVYGNASYVRRGTGRPAYMIGLQAHTNPRLRLLPWEELARSGYWFFSWRGGFVCTGINADPPREWLEDMLRAAPLNFEEPVDEGGRWLCGEEDNAVTLDFHNGVGVTIGLKRLASTKDPFIQDIALSMMPPRLGDVSDYCVTYSPDGWPEDKLVPSDAESAMTPHLERWLRMEIPDSELGGILHDAFCEQLDEGYMIGRRWYSIEDMDGFIEDLQGGKLEKEAVRSALESLEGGVRIDSNGDAHWLAQDFVRLSEGTAFSLLNGVWGKVGLDVLQDMFSIDEGEATPHYEKQLGSGKSFGGFLKKLEDQMSGTRIRKRFPWGSGVLPDPLDFADLLIKKARVDGLGSTTSMARKVKGDSSKAMGWAWLCVHGKEESEAWHFESSIRDKGGDWVPALTKLWEVSGDVCDGAGDDGYREAMDVLKNASGTLGELPE